MLNARPNQLKPIETDTKLPVALRRSRHVLLGMLFILLGAGTAVIGSTSIMARLTNVVVDNGLLNGRTVRVHSSIDGEIEAFYAQPGAMVESKQVLARISNNPSPQTEERILQLEQSQQGMLRQAETDTLKLESQLQTSEVELATTKESLALLETMLADLSRRDQSIRQVDVAIGVEAIDEQEAIVRAATARAAAAQSSYQRYQNLLDQGAVTAQETEQLRLEWVASEAAVDESESVLRSLQTAVQASRQGTVRSNRNNLLGGMLSDQQNSLLQSIQGQRATINRLEAAIAGLKQEINQRQNQMQNLLAPAADLRDLYDTYQTHEVVAPFTGVVYRTDYEQGEQISQNVPVLTLLDCNDLWAEAIVTARTAQQIDLDEPVKVHLMGQDEPIAGEIDLIQPISGSGGQAAAPQVQALNAVVPPRLAGEPLTRLTVRIPPPPEYAQAQQFCGIGQPVRLAFQRTLLTRLRSVGQ